MKKYVFIRDAIIRLAEKKRKFYTPLVCRENRRGEGDENRDNKIRTI